MAAIKPDPLSGKPRYQHVAEDLKRRIFDGEFGGVGNPIPTLPRLMEEYEVARQTASNAVRELIDCGLCVTQPGIAVVIAGEMEAC